MKRLALFLCLLIAIASAACQSSQPVPTLSPLVQPLPALSPLVGPVPTAGGDSARLSALESAVRQELDRRLAEYLGEGVGKLETVTASEQDGKIGYWRGRVSPTACPLVNYPLAFYGTHDGDGWKLYEDEDNTLADLGRAWAMAYSAAHGGSQTALPGLPVQSHISVVPAFIADILQAVLDGAGNEATLATAGFYVCITDQDGYGSLAGDDLTKVQKLVAEVRRSLKDTP